MGQLLCEWVHGDPTTVMRSRVGWGLEDLVFRMRHFNVLTASFGGSVKDHTKTSLKSLRQKWLPVKDHMQRHADIIRYNRFHDLHPAIPYQRTAGNRARHTFLAFKC